MSAVQFDDAVASQLVRVATDLDARLRSLGSGRRYHAADASIDFAGGYADRFRSATDAEDLDRVRLSRRLDELAEQVRRVASEARRERERRQAMARWRERQAARDRAAAGDALTAVGATVGFLVDPEPSDVPTHPTPIDIAFRASDRPRHAGGSNGGRSSADPERLRSFVAAARVADRELAELHVGLCSAWSAFTAACAWATVDHASLIRGFGDYVAENDADSAWIERIAEAFDRAGGGHEVANAVLDIAAADAVPAALQRLFAPGLSAADVAAAWSALGYSKRHRHDLAALPLSVLGLLGNLEGIPYWARHTANRTVLRQRLRRKNLDPVERAGLRNIDAALSSGRQLVSLTADIPPLAAISLGDLDTAMNVTWAVPGMGSDTLHMTEWVDACQSVRDQQREVGGSGREALVAWIGYTAPPIPSVGNVDFGVLTAADANAGATRLAAALRGFSAARGGADVRTNVLAHSYGTTTASIALTKHGVHVDAFVSIASAGIPQSIPTAGAMHADHVSAGQAANTLVGFPGFGDQYAYVGRDFSFPYRVDPTRSDFGADVFGADGTDTLKPVKDHGVHTENGRGYLDAGTESIRNVALATLGKDRLMTRPGP